MGLIDQFLALFASDDEDDRDLLSVLAFTPNVDAPLAERLRRRRAAQAGVAPVKVSAPQLEAGIGPPPARRFEADPSDPASAIINLNLAAPQERLARIGEFENLPAERAKPQFEPFLDFTKLTEGLSAESVAGQLAVGGAKAATDFASSLTRPDTLAVLLGAGALGPAAVAGSRLARAAQSGVGGFFAVEGAGQLTQSLSGETIEQIGRRAVQVIQGSRALRDAVQANPELRQAFQERDFVNVGRIIGQAGFGALIAGGAGKAGIRAGRQGLGLKRKTLPVEESLLGPRIEGRPMRVGPEITGDARTGLPEFEGRPAPKPTTPPRGPQIEERPQPLQPEARTGPQIETTPRAGLEVEATPRPTEPIRPTIEEAPVERAGVQRTITPPAQGEGAVLPPEVPVGPRGLEHAIAREQFSNTPSVERALKKIREDQPNLPTTMEALREQARRIPQAEVDELLAAPPKPGNVTPAMRLRIASEQEKVGDALLELNKQSLLLPETARQIKVLEEQQQRLARIADPTITNFALGLRVEGELARKAEFNTNALINQAKRRNGEGLSSEQVNELGKLAAEGREALGRGDKKAADKIQERIGMFMRDLRRTGRLETVSILRRAGMLTGVPTFIRNAGGNLGNLALEEAALVPASLIDSAIVLFSKSPKKRTVAGLLGKGTLEQNFRALKDFGHDLTVEGTRRFGEVMRKGATAQELRRFDSPSQVRSTLFGGDRSADEFINTYTNFVFRLQVAGDQFARAAAHKRSLTAQARVQAINELRKTGKPTREAVSKRIDEILANPSQAMRIEAAAQAEFMVFANESKIARALDKAREASGIVGPGGKFIFDAVLPFRRTPSNIAARVLDFSGVGGTAEIGKAIGRRLTRSGMTPEQQRRLSESIGRGLVGNGLVYLGYKMAEAGLMTGMYPVSTSERAEAEAASRPSGAMLDPLTNRWHRVIDFSPPGNLLTMGATHFERDVGVNLMGLVQSGAIALEVFEDQSFLQSFRETEEFLGGIRNIAEADNSTRADALAGASERLARFGGRFAASFVPSIVAGAARQLDDRKRDTRGRGSASEAFTRPIRERLPFVREGVPEALDRFGQPIQQGPAPLVDPTFSLPSREDDPLFAAFRESGAKFPSALRQNKRRGETENEFTLRRLRKGVKLEQELRKLISEDPLFQNTDPALIPVRRKILERKIRQVNRQ